MSKQATFNRVARHLLRQGRRAKAGTLCVLHAEDGSRCAAGVLVTRRDYRPDWEEYSGVESYSLSGLCVYLKEKGHHLGLVDDLQHVHDHVAPSRWAAALRRVAKRRKLSPAAVDECVAALSRKGGGA